MRLVRVAPAGSETPGVLVDDGTFVNVSDVVQDFNEAFFGSGMLATLDSIVTERVANGRTQPLGERRFGAPIARPHQILCIGLNYRDHAAETGQAVPTEPILTTSANSSLSSRETSSAREPRPGVGMGQSPQIFLKGGETVTLGMTRLGTQRQRVIANSAAVG